MLALLLKISVFLLKDPCPLLALSHPLLLISPSSFLLSTTNTPGNHRAFAQLSETFSGPLLVWFTPIHSSSILAFLIQSPLLNSVVKFLCKPSHCIGYLPLGVVYGLK